MFRNLKLSMKLALGFSFLLVLTTIVAMVGVYYIDDVASDTYRLIDHPYTVHTEILKVQRDVIAIEREMHEIMGSTDRKGIENSIKNINTLEQGIFKSFDLLYERFLG
ncbi:MAG: hypothetical protein GX316_07335, partial [Firmicutes bacterium]|nr:hypothetical protein [Bacillota bacterium]